MPINLPTTQMTGLASGLDWGQIVDSQMKKARKAQNPWYDRIQLLNDKIYLYNEFAAAAKGTKSSLDPLKLESTFKAKTTEMTVLSGGTSADSILKVEADPTSQISQWKIKVNELAVAEKRVSDRQESSSSALGLSGSLFLRCGTSAAEIKYDSSDSLRTIAQKIRSADIGLDAYLIDNRLIVESKNTGLGTNSFTEEITRGTGDFDALGAHGIDPDSIGNIKAGGTTYVKGTDFDVEEDPTTGGHRIKWGAKRPGKDVKYNVKYTHDANTFGMYEVRDSLNKDITRGTGVDHDRLDVANLDPDKVSIAGYDKDVDYEIVKDPTDSSKWAIHWKNNKPSDGDTYSVNYSTKANSLLSSIGILTDDSTHHTVAKDASLTLNGIDVTRSSNEIDDLIGGTTLKLQGAGEVNLEINLDAEKAVKAMESFVANYNDLMDYINIRSSEKSYNYSDKPNSDVKAKPEDDISRRKGLLASDSLLWQTKSSLRQIISYPHGTKDDSFRMLSEIGITTESADFGKSGKLEFNSTKFMEAMAADPSGVQKLVKDMADGVDAKLEGVISTSNTEVGGTVAKKGRVPSQISTWENEVSLIQKRIKDHETKLTTQQANMYKQYAQMEQRLAKLQAQSSSLSSIFAQMNKTQQSSGS